jgi:hypothetical protein
MQNKTFLKMLTMNCSTDLDKNRIIYGISMNIREVSTFKESS